MPRLVPRQPQRQSLQLISATTALCKQAPRADNTQHCWRYVKFVAAPASGSQSACCLSCSTALPCYSWPLTSRVLFLEYTCISRCMCVFLHHEYHYQAGIVSCSWSEADLFTPHCLVHRSVVARLLAQL